jgi:hypothetical protein
MDLQEFLRQSLVDIVSAVREAKKADPGIAPDLAKPDGDAVLLRTVAPFKAAFLVEFDIAVTVSRESSAGGSVGGGIIQVLSAKVDAKTESTNESVSRIKFTVPITYSR